MFLHSGKCIYNSMNLKTYKMWEDAAANSVGAGGIDGIGVGAKGEPGVHLDKKKKKKEQQILIKMQRRMMNGKG